MTRSLDDYMPEWKEEEKNECVMIPNCYKTFSRECQMF